MDIIERLLQDRPAFHQGGAARWDSTLGTLQYVRDHAKAGQRTLETGCGVSSVIFIAAGCEHTVISPDSREHERVKAYCDRIGISHKKVTFIAGFSDDILPSLLKSRVLDAALIDGAHSFPYPVVDWHYVTRALKIGGWLLMDDVPIPAVAPAFRFMQSDPAWRFDTICDNRTAAFNLVAEPQIEEWAHQPFNQRPDYSFASMPERAKLRARDTVSQARKNLAQRYPFLRSVRKELVGATPADDLK